MADDPTAEPPPSPETFGALYKILATSRVYRQITQETFGAGYGGQLSLAAPADLRLLAARAGLAPGQRVADLCCGMGGPSLFLAAEYGCELVAVDWSRQALAACRRTAQAQNLADHLRFVVGDIRTSLFAGEAFHAVVSIDGFYFGVDLPWLYGEIYRLLQPGGRIAFFFNVPSPEVVEASSPERRAHRESHRIDHLGALAAAGFIHARADERTLSEQELLHRLLAVYDRHFAALEAEIGAEITTALHDELAQTLHMAEHGYWPRYLFSARKPAGPPARRR